MEEGVEVGHDDEGEEIEEQDEAERLPQQEEDPGHFRLFGPVAPQAGPVESELDMFKLEEPLEKQNGQPDMHKSPLEWWKLKQGKYPILSRLARKYLGIRASSAACERLFSFTGHRVSKRKAKLDDENLLRITLARCLQKFVDTYENIYHEE